MAINKFGGNWTDIKLDRFSKYLPAFTTALKNKGFRLLYIDAFAGTGEIQPRNFSPDEPNLFDEKEEENLFKDGSAKIAIQCNPPFHRYLFIEKDSGKCAALNELRGEYPEKDIKIINGDCNPIIMELCKNENWANQRAVLFLDPFATELSWSTLEAIGKTGCIDTLILFPLSAINRLLTKDGDIVPSWERKLTEVFGSEGWKEQFYKTEIQDDLFEVEIENVKKIADAESILNFFIQRLEGSFRYVHKKPMILYNSRNSPLFGLCFACGHELALNIMKDILK